MRVSALSVWRGNHEVIAGIDPWDVVDEAWSSMAQQNFESKGPFLPFALSVARNKAVDAVRRAEAKRRVRSLDAPLEARAEGAEPTPLREDLQGSGGAEAEYFRGLDQLEAIQTLALAEEAIYAGTILSEVERRVFVAVRVHGKSRAAVGRELDPPVTGQRVGQIVARAFIKIQKHVNDHLAPEGTEPR
jgi:RNA polymerase sigma factor (sigma-70 family)